MAQPVWKAVWPFLTKLNVVLPYNSTIALLGIFPTGLKAYVHAKTGMNANSSFIYNQQKLEATKIPAIRIDKLWHMHKMECYSTMKRAIKPQKDMGEF